MPKLVKEKSKNQVGRAYPKLDAIATEIARRTLRSILDSAAKKVAGGCSFPFQYTLEKTIEILQEKV